MQLSFLETPAPAMSQDTQEQIEAELHYYLSRLQAEWKPSPPGDENPFMTAIAPGMSEKSRHTRQFTSRLGNTLEKLCNRIAELKYPSSFTREAYASCVEDAPYRTSSAATNPVIYSQYSQRQIWKSARELTVFARDASRIGRKAFTEKLEREMETVRNAPLDRTVSKYHADLICLNEEVGIAELKLGGDLDKTKGFADTEKLIATYLAYGDLDVPFRFAVLYANNGNGKPIKGALRSYFKPGEVRNGKSCLAVGEHWWNLLLPDCLSYEPFIKLYAEIGKDYQIQ